jgi:hypothetical protein
MTFGYCSLAAAAFLSAPHALITAILAVTGFGFGFASMSYLLAAQEAVEWQQRGLVTSAITFFRSIGGALGVGILGAMFNTISQHDLGQLAQQGITPAKLLDPHAAVGATLPPEAAANAQHVIARGLTWVFVAMAAAVIAQWLVTWLMPAKRCEHEVRAAEGLEAMA